MNFIKTFFSSCLGALVALVLFTILGIIIINYEPPVNVDDNSVLLLNISSPITELEVEDPVASFFPEVAHYSIGLIQLIQTINRAKDDPKIKGIYLNTEFVMAGFSTIDEIRNAVINFRKSGKWVVAYASYFSEGAFYLATSADKIYLNPQGMVEFNGLSTEVNFFKRLFDKLDIKPQVFRVGDFKSAVEPFLREDISEENKLQLNAVLNSINDNILSKVSESRNIQIEKVREISSKMLVRNSGQAKEFNLVDNLLYEDEVLNELRGRLGLAQEKKIKFIKYSSYKKSLPAFADTGNEIAVIVADGSIMPGKSDNGVVGASTIVEAFRRARTSEKVKAIVLRINSPGGSFNASDAMWREISLTAQVKPVIASMSDYAASGGYYLAMACDTIVAKPSSITGSIGVFSVLFDMSGFLGNKIGITSREIKTGDVGQLITMTRPLTEMERNIWQKQTDEVYEIFTSKAATGRKMKIEDLKKIASGRVWTGIQAKENGLIDILGSFDDAVNIAASKSGIGNDYNLKFYPMPTTFFEKFFEKGNDQNDFDEQLKKIFMEENLLVLNQWRKLKQYEGIQARMAIEFSLK